MINHPDLKKFVEKGLSEAINGSTNITKKVLKNAEDRYELKLSKNGEEHEPKLVLEKKGNGRPVPVVVVNAISSKGENLLYRDQRIDSSSKVAQTIKEALECMVESFE